MLNVISLNRLKIDSFLVVMTVTLTPRHLIVRSVNVIRIFAFISFLFFLCFEIKFIRTKKTFLWNVEKIKTQTKQENRIELKFCVGCPQKVSLCNKIAYQIFVLSLKFDKKTNKKSKKKWKKLWDQKQSNMKQKKIPFDTLW